MSCLQYIAYQIPQPLITERKFAGKDFENFCKIFSVEHLTTPPYHPKSNEQAEWFVETFKRALKKATIGKINEEGLQIYLTVYRLKHNSNTPSGMSPAELTFARKAKLMFDKLLQSRQICTDNKNYTKSFTVGDKVYFRAYEDGKETW